MNYFSMFSGIGGFELGIQRAFTISGHPRNAEESERAGLESEPGGLHDRHVGDPGCVGYSEIDKYAIKVYERQFDGHTNYGDATTINTGDLPDFDLLVGGFPCQAFSIAGKRHGFAETRGTLFFDVARILADKRPRHLVLENVKGLLTHDGGKTYKTILGVLTDMGYRIEWQVLNSKDWGVPQNRERIYIVGHLGGACGRQIFPLISDDRENAGQHEREVSGTIDTGYAKNHRQSGATYVKQAGVIDRGRFKATDQALTLDANYYKGHDNHGARPMVKQIGQIYDNPHNSQAGRIYDKDGLSPTLDVMGGGNRQPKIIAGQPKYGNGTKRSMEYKITDEAPTIRATQHKSGDNQPKVIEATAADEVRIRRLTPKECERLQGFPDDWTKHEQGGVLLSDTQRYKMCGNAVTVNTVAAVMKELLPCLAK